MSNTWKAVFCFVVVFLAASGGSVVTYDAIPTWYATLNKPPFNPPNWIFGPVWTVLYILMAISLYLVWSAKKSKLQSKAIKVFLVQLFLNFLWSLVFFGGQNIGLALLTIILLWASILYSIILFYKINKTASYLLIPYILWVSFASFLNLSIFLLN